VGSGVAGSFIVSSFSLSEDLNFFIFFLKIIFIFLLLSKDIQYSVKKAKMREFDIMAGIQSDVGKRGSFLPANINKKIPQFFFVHCPVQSSHQHHEHHHQLHR
jgi:hypothetical protein